MTLSPRLLKGGIVQMDPDTGQVLRVIALQYNPDSLSRTLQVQATGETGDRSQALRLKGAAIETIKLEAEIDAADQLEQPDTFAMTAQLGIYPQLAALEDCVYPDSATVQANIDRAALGTLEIIPSETPLALFIWGTQRVLPVRITELSVTEEAFSPELDPLRARVSLTLRVLTTNDVPRGHRAASLFMASHQAKERLAAGAPGQLSAFGLGRLP
jgi:contractile injection system tube protein